MRRHRITFRFPGPFPGLAPVFVLGLGLGAILCATACQTHKKEVETAKHSLYDAEFTVVYTAALEATRELYPEIEDAPGRGAIKTAWRPVSFANNEDDMANAQTGGNIQGFAAGSTSSGAAGRTTGGMPVRLSRKRFFIRFDISVAGGRPWRLKVVGHAAEWEPGAALPTELHGVARPAWLDSRTDALVYAIYKRVKGYAVPMPDSAAASEETKRSDPGAFGALPPGAGQTLAGVKDALEARDYTALRGQLADDVVWSLGGGAGADGAMALWQADPEPLEAMGKLLAGGCGGDARKVICPAAAPSAGSYQLVLEPRGTAWRITSFVKAE